MDWFRISYYWSSVVTHWSSQINHLSIFFKDVPQNNKQVKSTESVAARHTAILRKGMDRRFGRWDAQIIFSGDVRTRRGKEVKSGSLAISAQAELCTGWEFHSDPSASLYRALDLQLTVPALNKCQNKKLSTQLVDVVYQNHTQICLCTKNVGVRAIIMMPGPKRRHPRRQRR